MISLAVILAQFAGGGLIMSLIYLLIVAVVLLIVWKVVGMFVQGQIHQLVGIILLLILLVYALHVFGIALP